MSKPLEKELEVLEKDGVISDEVASTIRAYYKNKSENPSNRLFVVFAILGSILVGLGLILIIAHNWDELSRPTKVFFAFLPLVVGQLFCGFTILKKGDSQAWKEGSTVFLFFAVGACISLISQVYNIHGNLSTFLLTWMLLCLPLVYIMNSSMASLLYLVGITYYAVECHAYWSHSSGVSFHYWWLLALVLPHYYRLYKNSGDSNAMIFHNWIVPISLVFALGTMSNGHGNLLYMAYMSLFAMFYLIGNSDYFQNILRRINSYLVIGSLGTMHILLIASFNWFWEDLNRHSYNYADVFNTPELIITLVISVFALLILAKQQKNKGWEDFHPMKIIFMLFIILYSLGQSAAFFSLILINVLILANGIFTIRSGAKEDHLGVLNYGLLTITALVVCRFFDSHMSFIVRGLLFVLVGAGFFLTNYMMLKKRKANELNSKT